MPTKPPPPELEQVEGGLVVRPRKSLKTRRDPAKSRVQAFDELHEQLAVAAVVAESQGDGGRMGVEFAMRRVIDYLIARGLKPATIAPLRLVLDALEDAERGVPSPIFHVATKGGRPPKSEREKAGDSIVAVIAELCIREKKLAGVSDPAKQGAVAAAKIVRHSRLALDLTAARILKIRESVSSRPADDRIEYDILLQALPNGISPQAFAEKLAVSPSLGANLVSQ